MKVLTTFQTLTSLNDIATGKANSTTRTGLPHTHKHMEALTSNIYRVCTNTRNQFLLSKQRSLVGMVEGNCK